MHAFIRFLQQYLSTFDSNIYNYLFDFAVNFTTLMIDFCSQNLQFSSILRSNSEDRALRIGLNVCGKRAGVEFLHAHFFCVATNLDKAFFVRVFQTVKD